MTTLSSERTYAQLSRYRLYRSQLARIIEMLNTSARSVPDGWISELGVLYADLTGIRNLSYKIASLGPADTPLPGLPSITKLWWSTTHQRLLDLGFRVACHVGADEDYWFASWLEARAETIYAGSSEIQRNIIAERQLGLPR
jgi:alkylation response protein AidB-like acyl-CoA dehydrogenase